MTGVAICGANSHVHRRQIFRELLYGRKVHGESRDADVGLSALMKLVAKRFIAVDCPLPHSDWLQMFRARPSLLP